MFSHITEVTGKIASGRSLALTGLTLTEGKMYKLMATAEPEAKGTVETTFLFSTEDETTTNTKYPSCAIITGMPSPPVQTTKYTGGNGIAKLTIPANYAGTVTVISTNPNSGKKVNANVSANGLVTAMSVRQKIFYQKILASE